MKNFTEIMAATGRGWDRSVYHQELRRNFRKLFFKFWVNFGLASKVLLLDHRLFGITGLKSECETIYCGLPIFMFTFT